MAGEPVLGVVGQQAQDHLQAAAPGAQQRDLGIGVDGVGGSFAGIASRAPAAAVCLRRAAVIVRCAAGIRVVFLAATLIAGSAISVARSRSAAARVFSASRTAAFAFTRPGSR